MCIFSFKKDKFSRSTDDNLCGLNFQVQRPIVKKITDFLMTTHSTYAQQFLKLKDEIETFVKEAISNIEYLRILVDPSSEIDKCQSPSQIQEHLLLIIHLIRIIWLNSPFYNTQERIENLFKALSNQIIIICRDYINFDELFAGETRKYMDKFDECIQTCKNYIALYDQVM